MKLKILIFLGTVAFLFYAINLVEERRLEVEDQRVTKLETQTQRALSLLSQTFNREIKKDFTTYSIPVTLTGFTARVEECNEDPDHTACNSPSRVGIVALSRDLYRDFNFSCGDRVLLPDLGVFEVDCKMGEEKYKNTLNPVPIRRSVDILHATVPAAKEFGIRESILIWVGT